MPDSRSNGLLRGHLHILIITRIETGTYKLHERGQVQCNYRRKVYRGGE